MRRLAFLLAIPFLLHADDASKRTKAEQLLTAMKSDALSRQMIEQFRTTMMNRMGTADAPAPMKPLMEQYRQKMIDLVADHLQWSRLKPKIVTIYAESFTEEELNGILAFYASPAGHALVDKMPGLVTKSMEISQKEMETLQPEIQRLSDELLAKLKAQTKEKP